MEKSRTVSVASARNFKFLGFALEKGRNGYFYPRLRKVDQESQTKAEGADFPQPGLQKCTDGNGTDKGLHPGMAGLFRDCEQENHNAGMGWVVAPPTADVHVEAVEGAKGSNQRPHETGRAGIQRP